VLPDDLERPAQRRVARQAHVAAPARHRRVHHHLLAAVEDARHVAAGDVGQVRLRHASREPQVHVVEGAGDHPDADIAGPRHDVVDVAEAVGAG
jgi:hypothetical protein